MLRCTLRRMLKNAYTCASTQRHTLSRRDVTTIIYVVSVRIGRHIKNKEIHEGMSKMMLDDVLNAPTAVTTTVTVSTFNMLGNNLPLVINIATAIYLFLLIVHKGYKMYRHYKYQEHESEE